jgi:hypothetical protein
MLMPLDWVGANLAELLVHDVPAVTRYRGQPQRDRVGGLRLRGASEDEHAMQARVRAQDLPLLRGRVR